MYRNRLVAIVILALGPVVSAYGGVITFHADLATFNAAIGATPAIIEDFTPDSHFPISTGILNSSTNLPGIGIVPGTIKPGVTYSTPVGPGFFFNIDRGGGFPGGFLDTIAGGNQVLTVTFDTPQQFFGFDASSTLTPLMNLTINFPADPSLLFPVVPTSTNDFFGFVSSASDITSLTLSGPHPNFSFALDNFRFGGTASQSVPEPGSLALLGIALGAFGLSRRRKKA